MSPKSVTFFVFDQARLIDVTGPLEVFATANAFEERELYELRVASPDGRDVRCGAGTVLGADLSVEDLTPGIDLLMVPGTLVWDDAIEDEALLDSLRRAVSASKRVAAVCAGAFLLAAIGRLDGRRAATHWMLAEQLAARFPEVKVEADPIFIEDGETVTAAGGTSGIDLALALVEADHGADLARQVAQFLVVFMQRPGGQAQFSARMLAPLTDEPILRNLLDAIAEEPAADHRLAAMSERAGFSERHLTRIFRREIGVTPARYVESVRFEAARGMLETSDAPLAAIARDSGLSSAETLRRVFSRELGITPHAYRGRFRTTGVIGAQ